MSQKYLPLVLVLITGSACGSSYTILDRTEMRVSANSQTVARTLLPNSDRNPALMEHLALAEEIYQQQLRILHERRNKNRARKRDLGFASYGILSAASLGVGGLAIGAAATGGDNSKALVGASALSLVGLGIGTILQLTSAMQEEVSVVDDKVRTLQRSYEGMLDRVRTLSQRAQETPAEAVHHQAQIAATIENFINDTLQINAKG